MSDLKENHQALGLFVEKDPEKHEAFKYPLTTFHFPLNKLPTSLHLKENCISQKPSIFLEII